MHLRMDINTYQDNEDAFALLSILRMAEKDIENGNVKDFEEVFEELRKKLKNMLLKWPEAQKMI